MLDQKNEKRLPSFVLVFYDILRDIVNMYLSFLDSQQPIAYHIF